MRTRMVIFTALLLIVSLGAFSRDGDNEKKKVITKSFRADKNTQLRVSNKYGNISIVEWNKNEINFSIEIVGYANKEADAQKMLDRVNVNFNQTGNTVLAQTTLDEMRNFKCNNCGQTINYTINIPAGVRMDLENRYGDIFLTETTQPFVAKVKYGGLTAERLMGTSNDVDIKYGSIHLGEAKALNLILGYSNGEINKAEKLDLSCAYSKLRLGTIGTLDMTSKYDNFNITEVDDMVFSSGYSDFTIGRLGKKLDATSLSYCKFRIRDVATSFQSITIEAKYTNIRLGLTDQHSCKLEASSRYGSIKTGDLPLSNVKFDNEKYSQVIHGVIGNTPNPTALIRVSNSYDSIILTR